MVRKNRGRRVSAWTWSIVGTVVAAAFIAGVVIALWPRASAPTQSPEASAPSFSASPSATAGATEVAPSASSAAAGTCPQLSTDTDFPVEPPATTWEAHPMGIYMPVSTDFGPAKRDGNFWQCYSHTPKGALYAGINLFTSFASLDDKAIDAALPSAEREKAWADQKRIDADYKKEGRTFQLPSITSYRIIATARDTATIDYLAPVKEQHAYLRVLLQWDQKAGDWRLDVSQGVPTWAVATDPTAFTTWK